MPETSHTRPYLDTPLDAGETQMVLQWVNYLGTTFGTSGALCALRYYERLSWITADARLAVENHLHGLSIDEIHSKKYDEPAQLNGPLVALSGTPFGAHAKSLQFISELAEDDLEADMLRADMARHKADADLARSSD